MSTADANNLTTGSTIFFRNLVNLKNYLATVSSITRGQTISVSVTTPAVSHTYPLGGDGTCEIPISALN